jgi:hypothetical protein
MDKAKVNKIFGTSYRIFELIVVLLVTVLVVTIGLEKYYDRVDYTDAWEMYLIALTWLFFVSLPLLIVYIVSFFRSLTFRTILHKIIFGGHILNIALWFLFYFMLPKPEPITAAMMEKNYLNHEPEMRDLINYTRSCLEDSTGIDFQMRNGEIVELNVNRLWEAGAFWDKESKSQLDSVIISVGITPAEFDTIQAKMTSAGVIGIKTFRKGYMTESCLSYAWYGSSNYVYELHDSKVESKEYRGYDELWLNDSVSFVNMRNMTGHTFPDRDEFIKKHSQK